MPHIYGRVPAAAAAGEGPNSVGEWSDDLLQMLDGQLSALLQLDLARSSRKAYDLHVQQYLEMCVRLRKPGVPAAATLARFVLGRAVFGYKLSYIELAVSAVGRWPEDQGVLGLGGETLVVRALKVAAKLAVWGVAQKLPLSTISKLRQVVKALPKQGHWICFHSFAG